MVSLVSLFWESVCVYSFHVSGYVLYGAKFYSTTFSGVFFLNGCGSLTIMCAIQICFFAVIVQLCVCVCLCVSVCAHQNLFTLE